MCSTKLENLKEIDLFFNSVKSPKLNRSRQVKQTHNQWGYWNNDKYTSFEKCPGKAG